MISGCGDNMSKLSSKNPEVYQRVNRLAECAGNQLASGQLSNPEMARENADGILMIAVMFGAPYGITDKDVKKIADAKANSWQGTTITTAQNLISQINQCNIFINTLPK